MSLAIFRTGFLSNGLTIRRTVSNAIRTCFSFYPALLLVSHLFIIIEKGEARKRIDRGEGVGLELIPNQFVYRLVHLKNDDF